MEMSFHRRFRQMEGFLFWRVIFTEFRSHSVSSDSLLVHRLRNAESLHYWICLIHSLTLSLIRHCISYLLDMPSYAFILFGMLIGSFTIKLLDLLSMVRISSQLLLSQFQRVR